MRLRPALLAVVLSLPLFVATSVGVDVHAEPRPVAPSLRSVGLAVVGTSSAARTSAAASELRLETPVTPLTEPVTVVGVTWQGPVGASVAVEVRQQQAGTWQAWQPLDVEDSEEGVRRGSEPLVVIGAGAVQARVSAPSGGVADARLDLVDPGTSPADADPDPQVAGSADAAVSRPTILTRAQWGADESLVRSSPSYATVRAAVIHHTAGTNTYTAEQVPAVMRGIYAFHVQGRGWNDIAYNVLVDRFGRLWEGRAGGVQNGVVGAHVAGYNTGSFGVSVMGTYESAAPPAAAQDAVSRVIAWKLSLTGVAATSTTSLAGRTIPAIVAHRDLGQTSCPGDAFYARMGAIRTSAAQIQAGSTPPAPADPTPDPTPTPTPTPTPVDEGTGGHDLDGDGHPDVVSSVVSSGSGVRVSVRVPSPVLSGKQIGTGWATKDLVVGSPDLGGDSRPDLVARDGVTGALWLYQSDGRGGFTTTRQIGSGWGGMRHLVAPGDWDGDARADLLGITTDGTMYLYRGLGTGRFVSGKAVGWGWGAMTSVVGVGDLDGDGRRDLVALDGTGTARTYSGNGRGGFVRSTVLATEWSDVDALVGVGDWDRDGRPDLITRDTAGRMTTRFATATGLEAPSTWGNGWGGTRVLVGPGDWDGDGRNDLLAISAADAGLRLYRGTGARDFATPTALQLPVAQVRDTLVIGDLDGNGRSELVVRDAAGGMFIAFVQGRGVVSSTRQVGWNWGHLDLLTAAGDLSGDGVPDLTARHPSTGALLLFTLARSGSITGQQQIGSGWGGMDLLVGPGPFDEDGHADLVARRASDGALLLYTGTGTSRLGTMRQVGSRWGGIAELVGIRDHDGDGAVDLLARTGAGTDLVYLGNGAGGFLGSRQVLGIPSADRLS